MIEIVKEPTPVEKVVEEPRNVRQIGTLPKDAACTWKIMCIVFYMEAVARRNGMLLFC